MEHAFELKPEMKDKKKINTNFRLEGLLGGKDRN